MAIRDKEIRAGVIGAGQMGQGIAQVLACAGVEVRLVDVDLERASRGRALIEASLDRRRAKGHMDATGVARAMSLVSAVEGFASFADCDWVIEAASEQQHVKEKLFRGVSEHVREDAVLASNTSSISITALASCVQCPERFVGLHFMNPVPVMELVEVIPGLQTSGDTRKAAEDLVRLLGKQVVVARDTPAFLVNRLLLPMLNEACFLLQEGAASLEDIDKAVQLGLHHPMGPFALADFVGLDTVLAIADVLQRDLGEDKYRPAHLLRQYVAAGWLGKKSGRGFYDYRKQ